MKTVTRRFSLWRADLEAAVCAAPEECVGALRDRESVAVTLDHRTYGLEPAGKVFESSLLQDVEWQFTGIAWPADLLPGTLVTVSWQPATDEVVVRTTPLDEPIRVDGIDYFHEYDPKVVTREFDAGKSNRGRVLHAVRRQGRVYDDGSAVLPEAGLAAHCGLGRGARGQFLLGHAVDQLIREGFLTRVPGSVDATGYPMYPAVDGQKPAEMLFYAPLVEEGLYPGEDESDPDRAEHRVNGFVRKLPPGAQASEKQVTLHQQAVEEDGIEADPLAPGYTYVKKHHRT
jgi:hypothetical protein